MRPAPRDRPGRHVLASVGRLLDVGGLDAGDLAKAGAGGVSWVCGDAGRRSGRGLTRRNEELLKKATDNTVCCILLSSISMC